MSNPVKPIPDGYATVTPYIILSDAAAALDFYARAFGAVVTSRHDGPDGKVGHAEIRIGSSMIMLADEALAMGARSARTLGGSPVMIYLYVEDVDSVFARAVAAGATVIRPVADQFYGDRSGGIEDPFGNQWWIGTHVEDVPPDEMARRAEKAMQEPGAA